MEYQYIMLIYIVLICSFIYFLNKLTKRRMYKNTVFLKEKAPFLHKDINEVKKGVLYQGKSLEFITVSYENLTTPVNRDLTFNTILKSKETSKYYEACYQVSLGDPIKCNLILIQSISIEHVKSILSNDINKFEAEFGKPVAA